MSPGSIEIVLPIYESFNGRDWDALFATPIPSLRSPITTSELMPGFAEVGMRYRELDEAETTTWLLVDGPTNVDKRELSIETPIAKSLIGHELNEVVDLALPKRLVRVEIVEIAK